MGSAGDCDPKQDSAAEGTPPPNSSSCESLPSVLRIWKSARNRRLEATSGSSIAKATQHLCDLVDSLAVATTDTAPALSLALQQVIQLINSDNTVEVSPLQLLQILTSMKRARILHRGLMKQVVYRVPNIIHRFSCDDLSELADTLMHLGELSGCAMTALLSEAMIRGFHFFSLRQLSSLLSASRSSKFHGLLERTIVAAGKKSESFHVLVFHFAQESGNGEATHFLRLSRALKIMGSSLHATEAVSLLGLLALLDIRDTETIACLCSTVLSKLVEVTDADLSGFCWSLGVLGHHCASVAGPLADEIAFQRQEVLPCALLKIAYGLTMMGFRCVPVLHAIAEVVCEEIDSFHPSDLGHIAWVFGSLQFTHQQAMVRIANEVIQKWQLFDATCSSNIAWGFASLRLRHSRMMDCFALRFGPLLHTMDDEDISRLAWSFGVLDLSPTGWVSHLRFEVERRFGIFYPNLSCEEAACVNIRDGDLSQMACNSCGHGNHKFLPYCENCAAPCATTADAVADESIFKPSMGPSKSAKKPPEFKKLERMSQRKRKQFALETKQGRLGPVNAETALMDVTARGVETTYESLLEALREELRSRCGDDYASKLSEQEVVSTEHLHALYPSQEDRDSVLKLLEARRVAEKAPGRRRQRSAQSKSKRDHKKLDRDYVANEITMAYQAGQNGSVRYFNSVAIKVKKGEKTVDAHVIDAVAQQQAGTMPTKATKEDRMMLRRTA